MKEPSWEVQMAELRKQCLEEGIHGPWEDEPDRLEFEHVGLPCLLLRNRLGAWCGYAAVPPGHPFHGESDYDKPDVSVHGGLTFAESCGTHICHVPKPGEPDNVWWFGFDCLHAGDDAPGMLLSIGGSRNPFRRYPLLVDVTGIDEGQFVNSYKSIHYARRQTEQLAEQLKALG